MRSAWSNSVSPLIAGLLTAAIFVAGAGAFELGRATGFEPAATEELSVHTDNFRPLPDPVPYVIAETRAPQPVSDTRPVVVLVIDDAGIDPGLTRQAMDLPVALTLSFLPYAEATPALALEARERGHDIFLHLPMEPYGLDDPGPGALTRHLSREELRRRVDLAFRRVPGATGFNNHMGSAFTADAAALTAAFSSLEGSDLVFLDSLTSGRSQAYRVASRAGLTALRRDIFIDHVPGEEMEFLDAMATRARSEGQVIAIAHPRPGTLEALSSWIAAPQNQDIRFITVSQLLESDPATDRLAGAAGNASPSLSARSR
ncbi:divergent polysaccharide deacetylase family protein [Hyphobacterium sp. HN65]|uniref:Divergent polysaccharide deacetylase family protein n=1 Tax=Hyphobacterium lacteum TaxID=3116575 RepID=A0ABU7LMS1_9PROT|nr:divergent polysaccharide deacetylase family protein [Hyphobacterium sp. HN65]MEE2524911.1 divergent polysaccharide deacetylase family protein [Hyphobacterium sp. HN65]